MNARHKGGSVWPTLGQEEFREVELRSTSQQELLGRSNVVGGRVRFCNLARSHDSPQAFHSGFAFFPSALERTSVQAISHNIV